MLRLPWCKGESEVTLLGLPFGGLFFFGGLEPGELGGCDIVSAEGEERNAFCFVKLLPTVPSRVTGAAERSFAKLGDGW